MQEDGQNHLKSMVSWISFFVCKGIWSCLENYITQLCVTYTHKPTFCTLTFYFAYILTEHPLEQTWRAKTIHRKPLLLGFPQPGRTKLLFFVFHLACQSMHAATVHVVTVNFHRILLWRILSISLHTEPENFR